MLHWLRKGPAPYDAAVAMIGIKGGDRLLILDAGDPALSAELARITGLNGHTAVCASSAHRAAVEAAAQAAGALIDFQPREMQEPPRGQRPYDLALWVAPLVSETSETRTRRAHELFAALRPGGRTLIIDDARARGLGFLKRGSGPSLPPADVVSLLISTGGLAARSLGAIHGLTYYEARKTSNPDIPG